MKFVTVGVKCFKCREKGYKYRKCPTWKGVEKRRVEKVAYVVKPQKAQQKELRRAKKEEAARMAKP